jgi:hypothetical protein
MSALLKAWPPTGMAYRLRGCARGLPARPASHFNSRAAVTLQDVINLLYQAAAPATNGASQPGDADRASDRWGRVHCPRGVSVGLPRATVEHLSGDDQAYGSGHEPFPILHQLPPRSCGLCCRGVRRVRDRHSSDLTRCASRGVQPPDVTEPTSSARIDYFAGGPCIGTTASAA